MLKIPTLNIFDYLLILMLKNLLTKGSHIF